MAWLSAWLVRQAWPVRWQLDVGSALRAVMRERPRLVIVDVNDPRGLPPRVALIAEVHRRRPETGLAAAAARADASVERAVRAAGADLYLVHAADLPALDAILAAAAAPHGAAHERSPPLPRRRRRTAHRIRGRPPPPRNSFSSPVSSSFDSFELDSHEDSS